MLRAEVPNERRRTPAIVQRQGSVEDDAAPCVRREARDVRPQARNFVVVPVPGPLLLSIERVIKPSRAHCWESSFRVPVRLQRQAVRHGAGK